MSAIEIHHNNSFALLLLYWNPKEICKQKWKRIIQNRKDLDYSANFEPQTFLIEVEMFNKLLKNEFSLAELVSFRSLHPYKWPLLKRQLVTLGSKRK